ncbi:MAG: hypothetical protein ACLFR1_03210 [Spirochaetia bacterium]
MIPWKLIGFLTILTLFVVFAGFNITNVSDISFGLFTISDVPIFLSLFAAYIVGGFTVLPFAFTTRKNRNIAQNKNPDKKQKAISQEAEPSDQEPMSPKEKNS